MQPDFSTTTSFKVMKLGEEKIENMQAERSGGWTVTLFLVMKGKLSITEWHPSFRHPGQFVIGENAVYCTRHSARRKMEVEDGARGYVIQFEQSVLNWKGDGADYKNQTAFYRLMEHPAVLSLGCAEMNRIEWICTMLTDELGSNCGFGSQVIPSIIDLLLVLVVRNAESTCVIDKPVNILLHKFNRLLEEHYKIEKTVSGYAGKLFVTAGYLNAIIKRDTGYPVGYHIRKRIVVEALRHARYMDTSVKEVADVLGFTDAAHFSKFFKKETGMNFSGFRRQRYQHVTAA